MTVFPDPPFRTPVLGDGETMNRNVWEVSSSCERQESLQTCCSRSLAPIEWVGLSIRITCALCKIVVQERSAPRCANLITIGGLETTQAPGMEAHARSSQWTGRQSGRLVASLPAIVDKQIRYILQALLLFCAFLKSGKLSGKLSRLAERGTSRSPCAAGCS